MPNFADSAVLGRGIEMVPALADSASSGRGTLGVSDSADSAFPDRGIERVPDFGESPFSGRWTLGGYFSGFRIYTQCARPSSGLASSE